MTVTSPLTELRPKAGHLMASESTDAPVRRDVEPRHHYPGALLPHTGQGLQQVDDFDVRQHIVGGCGLQCLPKAQLAGANLALQVGASAPRFGGSRAGSLELLGSELWNGHGTPLNAVGLACLLGST